MRLKRAAFRKTKISIYVGINSYFALDSSGKLTNLENGAMDIVNNDANSLGQQIMESGTLNRLPSFDVYSWRGTRTPSRRNITFSSRARSDSRALISRHENRLSARVGSVAVMCSRFLPETRRGIRITKLVPAGQLTWQASVFSISWPHATLGIMLSF